MIKQMEGQVSLSDVDGWCGKTCREPLVQEHQKGKISESCLKKSQKSQMKVPLFLDLRTENGHQADVSWETDGQSLGCFMMHSTTAHLKGAEEYVCVLTSTENPHQEYYLNCGEKPLTPNPTKLSQILEWGSNTEKYKLSPKACQGILNRAERRGKELPKILKEALIRQASPLRSGGGREVDSHGRKAGKGALIQEELSGTLGVSQDQTLIQCLNSWDIQSKHIQPQDGIAESLYSGECRGGGGESYVLQSKCVATEKEPFLFEPRSQDGVHRMHYDGVCPTLNTAQGGQRQPCICYGISSYESNAMKSNNPHSGIYEADTSRTLDLNGGNPNCAQGGMIVIEGNGSRESHKGDGYRESETMYTLNATEHHAIAYRKKGHPQNAQQGQGWEEAEINDTLNNNNNDNTDGHTPTVIVEIRHKHHRRKKNGQT